jgi:hypothetical protein
MTVDEKALEAAVAAAKETVADGANHWEIAYAVIDAYEAAKGGGGVAGWVMVPREPTPEMLTALRNEANVNGYGPRGAALCYRAMLAAAPAAPPAVDLEKVEEALEWIAGMAEVRAADDKQVFTRVNRGALRNIASRARSVLSDIRKARE